MSMQTAKQSTTGTVGAASAVLANENLARKELIVVNTHATQNLSIAFATTGAAPTAVAGSGVVLYPQGTFVTEFRGALAVIGSGAGTTYSLAEL